MRDTTPRSALAVFVKTPTLSPIKTRLAAEIGAEKANEFYKLTLTIVSEVFRDLPRLGIVPIWAVAEPDGINDPFWSSAETIPQGDGDLGERLFHIYTVLRAQFDKVLVAGSDVPLLSAMFVADAVERLDREDFVLSRSADGGYALFGGRTDLPEAVWTGVPYSCARTAEVFLASLREYGQTGLLAPLSDVDTRLDLQRLLDSPGALTPAQLCLKQWVERQIGEKPSKRS